MVQVYWEQDHLAQLMILYFTGHVVFFLAKENKSLLPQ